ncbi:hypothetical protein D3C72_1848050 [compost metagenome]
MAACGSDLGEDVLVADDVVAVEVDVARHRVEPGDHFRHVVRHHQGMGLARGFHDERALGVHLFMLEIEPAALEHHRMHRAEMLVARQHAGLTDAQQIDVISLRHAEAQRQEGDAIGLGDPADVIDVAEVAEEDVRARIRRQRIHRGLHAAGIVEFARIHLHNELL